MPDYTDKLRPSLGYIVLCFVLVAFSVYFVGCAPAVRSTGASYSFDALPDNPIYRTEGYKDYMRLIRQRIADSALKHSYGSGTGKVAFIFELKSNGKLRKLVVDTSKTTASRKTIQEAVIAFKKSLPFPPFPEMIRHEFKTLTFTTLLSYEKEHNDKTIPTSK